MESSTTPVLTELAQVHGLASKLAAHLHHPSQIELCRAIAEEMLYAVKKAICMAKSTGGVGEVSPFSSSGGQYDDHQQIVKKRKMLPQCTTHMSASTLRGSEGLPDDGHTWRKYGQKEILNAKHPRAYYRCTHRRTQGCLAMKQVQRSDDNPFVLNITYRGTHTCSNFVHHTVPRSDLQDPHQSLFEQEKRSTIVDLQNSLGVKTENSDLEAQDASTSLFSFLSTPLNPENDLYFSSPNLESCFLGGLSSAFLSPTNSESNCHPWSSCQNSSHGNPKPDLTEIISMETCATSVMNSTMLDVNYMLRTGEMDTNVPIDISSFFEWNSAA